MRALDAKTECPHSIGYLNLLWYRSTDLGNVPSDARVSFMQAAVLREEISTDPQEAGSCWALLPESAALVSRRAKD
jgi:hypothetical protein